jgi:hypothetical protein
MISRKLHFEFIKLGFADLDLTNQKLYIEFWDFCNELRTPHKSHYGHERMVFDHPFLELWDDDINLLEIKCLICKKSQFFGTSVEERDWGETLQIISQYKTNHKCQFFNFKTKNGG